MSEYPNPVGYNKRGFLDVEEFSMKLPLVDEQGRNKGSLYKSNLKIPRNIPRIGEKVVIVGGALEGKVAEVIHSRFFASVHIRFEPVLDSWRSEVENSEWDKGWVWRES